jgi:hypothetical protein
MSLAKGGGGVSLFLLLLTAVSSAQVPVGLTGSAGFGVFIASDKDYYYGISTDMYPELGVDVDVSMLRLGLKAGYIYRKLISIEFPYGSSYSYKKIFVPLQAELLVAPGIGSKEILFSPYFGFMAGVFLPAGDNSSSLSTFSAKVGAEVRVADIFSPFGEIQYAVADDGGADAGGVMIVVGAGVRIPFQ